MKGTGCSTIVVRKELVPKECLSGKHYLFKLANSEIQKYPFG